MIEIRPYQDADFEHLKRLLAELQTYERAIDPRLAEPAPEFLKTYLEHLFTDIQEKRGIILVAADGDLVCGFTAGYAEKDLDEPDKYFYIAELVVAEVYRGQGIGSNLVHSLEDHARQHGFKQLRISVLARNVRVHTLYHRLGFNDYTINLTKPL